ncbi:Asa1p SCDLUD_000537 [Saccharomycodes ludwigii]|uniref:Asa1p n=1 Tax=Saccharomycodes ludwigii TaxID=36035 RepID=UPI001E830E06|nr:hypothetical protein SCDLUD_000537 [Saccharomycodes ludwigii]KAH3902938.1 hypothetical protein SCDLUD_000537 [Saccharomycodes ludwigii]
MIEIDTFTLRYHKSRITAIHDTKITVPNTAVNGVFSTQQSSLMKITLHTLFSGDANGVLIQWNLITRRPINTWKVSDSSIISIGTLSLYPNCEYIVDYDKQYEPLIKEQNELSSLILYVQSKNHTLKFYQVNNMVNNVNGNNNSEKQNGFLWEMPINTLNFSNLIVYENRIGVRTKSDRAPYIIWCCNTQNSENIDIYEINPFTKHLERIYESINFNCTHPLTQRTDDTNRNNRGVVMRLEYCSDINSVVIGYEDGSCILVDCTFIKNYKIHDTNIDRLNALTYKDIFNKDMILSDDFKSEPVLSIHYDFEDHRIMIGKAKDRFIYKYDLVSNKITKYSMGTRSKEYSVANVFSINQNLLCYNTWESNSLFICKIIGDNNMINNTDNIIDVSQLKVLRRLGKMKSNVSIIPLDSIHNFNDENIDNGNSRLKTKRNNYVKIGAVCVLSQANHIFSDNEKQKNISLLRYKKEKYLMENTWIILGYEDGTISVNKLTY